MQKNNLRNKIFSLPTILAAISLMGALPTATFAQPTHESSSKTAARRVAYRVYKSYFESNNSNLKGANSYLFLRDQQSFDRIFGAAAVMGKNDFLPADAFGSQSVAAVIKRGSSIWNYSVQQVLRQGNSLHIRYKATRTVSSGASFASPLIVAFDKANYQSIVFIENGRRVGIAHTLAAQSPQVKVFLVAVGDKGKIGRKFGCDDSLVAVTRAIAPTQSPLNSALQLLLSMPRQDVKNPKLENFWKGRDLRLKSVSLRNGVATIVVSGEVFVAGICDEPRIIEQIEATARQFPSVKRVRVFMGRVPLARAIS